MLFCFFVYCFFSEEKGVIAHIKLEGTAPASAQRDEVEKLHPPPVISALAHEEDTAAIKDENTC